jgi:hypothetical protein
MVLRKPNLLDAFQASAPEGKKAPPGKPPASAAGPFAQERAASAALPKLAPQRRSLASQMASDRLVQFAVVVCLVGIGIAYWIGHSNSKNVIAQTPLETEQGGTAVRENPAGAAQTPDPVEQNRKAAQLSNSKHDQAFLDPQYRFTVRVAQYGNDEAGKKAALADRDYLRAEGLPVVQPYAIGRQLIVCVGYTKTLEEAREIVKFVSPLSGPKSGRKNPYKDAWVDNISNVAARK